MRSVARRVFVGQLQRFAESRNGGGVVARLERRITFFLLGLQTTALFEQVARTRLLRIRTQRRLAVRYRLGRVALGEQDARAHQQRLRVARVGAQRISDHTVGVVQLILVQMHRGAHDAPCQRHIGLCQPGILLRLVERKAGNRPIVLRREAVVGGEVVGHTVGLLLQLARLLERSLVDAFHADDGLEHREGARGVAEVEVAAREAHKRLGLRHAVGRLLGLHVLGELAVCQRRLVHLEAHLGGGAVGEKGGVGGIELVRAREGVDGLRVLLGRKVRVALGLELLCLLLVLLRRLCWCCRCCCMCCAGRRGIRAVGV